MTAESNLYETDILSWSEHQTGLLRRRAAGELVDDADLDWPNIAEAIASFGHSERSKLRSHIATVLDHLVELAASPTVDHRDTLKMSALKARRDIHLSLKRSPSLHGEAAQMIADETPGARKDIATMLAAYREQPRVDIDALTFTEEQVLGNWLPDA
jgi:Domain of unknown function DUF29